MNQDEQIKRKNNMIIAIIDPTFIVRDVVKTHDKHISILEESNLNIDSVLLLDVDNRISMDTFMEIVNKELSKLSISHIEQTTEVDFYNEVLDWNNNNYWDPIGFYCKTK